MALLCHFPLDGRLDNLVEGSDITLTNNGATVSNYGKLGQCYESSSVTNKYITMAMQSSLAMDTDQFSITMWCKFKRTNTTSDFVFSGGTSSTNRGLHVGRRGTNNKITFAFYSNDLDGTKSVVADKWYLLCFVYQNKEQRIYIDGVLDTKRTTTSNLNMGVSSFRIFARTWETTTSSAYMNDLRIYDHALTDAEVAGLVATRKLLSSDGVERIGKNIIKEMERRGNKPYPLPEGATFAADFRESLCAWTPTGMMEPLGYDRMYESEDRVYKNSLSTTKKLDIQRTDKGVWIGYGSENLINLANNHAGCSATWVSENRVKIIKTSASTSAYFGFGVHNYSFKPGTRYNFKFKVIEKSEGSNLRIGSATAEVWKEGVYGLMSPEVNKEHEYFRTTVDNISEKTNLRMFHIYPNSGGSTTGDYAIVDIFMEENPLYTPKIEKSRGISTLLYPHKFTGEGTTTVIKFYGKLHEGPYKGSNSNYYSNYILSNGNTSYGYSITQSNRTVLNYHLNEDSENTIVILKGASVRTYVNGQMVASIVSLDSREEWEKTGYTMVGKRSATHGDSGDSASQNHWSQLLHFNRELSEKEIEYISNSEIEIPYEELSPKTINQHIQKDTTLSWKSIRDNYDTMLIPNSSTDLPLKPSKTYIIIDSNGNRYKSKISAAGAVTACTGSTNVLSSVSGMIRVTGSVTFPVSLEII